MHFLRREGLPPEREEELRRAGARRDATGAFLVVREGTEGAQELPVLWLTAHEFQVELHVPHGQPREVHKALTDGRWREAAEQDVYSCGVYRMSRSHAEIRKTRLPALWTARGQASNVRLSHYQEQAGGDVLVMLHEHHPDDFLAQLLIEGAKHTWLAGDELLMLGPPAYNKTIAQLAIDGAEAAYEDDLLGRAVGTPAATGQAVRPRVAKDMVANPCRFQIVEASVGYLKMLASRLDESGERQGDQWLVPRDRALELVQELRDRGIELLTRRLDGRVRDYEAWAPDLPEDEGPGRPRAREPVAAWDLPGPVPGLKAHAVLDAHQVRGAAYIQGREHRCIVGDEMGLGKTLTALAAAQYLQGPKLVVCPSNARGVWRAEIEQWIEARSEILRPGGSSTDIENRMRVDPVDYVVVSYDGLARFQDLIRNTEWALVILDEGHYLRNRRTRRVQLARELLLRIPRRVMLTGTPLMNNPGELRGLLYFIAPDEWDDAAWFRARFERPWERGTAEVREQVVDRLHKYLYDVMIRRVKADIFHELPEKNTHVTEVELSPAWAREYAEEEALYASDVRAESDVMGSLSALNRLRQLAVNGKLDAVVPHVRTLLEHGEKVVVFGFFLHGIRTMDDVFADYDPVVLTGASTDPQREEAVRRFMRDPECKLFLGQVNAAGQAITLTSSRHVVFLDLVWNPSVLRQAMDRVHRRGQERDVHVHFFITRDTVEEDIRDVLENKARLVDAVVDDAEFRDVEAVQWEVTSRLLERRERRKK